MIVVAQLCWFFLPIQFGHWISLLKKENKQYYSCQILYTPFCLPWNIFDEILSPNNAGWTSILLLVMKAQLYTAHNEKSNTPYVINRGSYLFHCPLLNRILLNIGKAALHIFSVRCVIAFDCAIKYIIMCVKSWWYYILLRHNSF